MVQARVFQAVAVVLLVGAIAGCATPGADYPRRETTALEQPAQTTLGRKTATRAAANPGLSGFKLLPRGADSFALRAQLADAAERTLDLQYFVFQEDDSGYLLMDALLRAAKRGVRVRLLLDDPQARAQDSTVAALIAHPNIEIRLYNPMAYRGRVEAIRWVELAFSAVRLNQRMHNKLFVADNAVAIAGGRNVGDPYFEGGKDLQFSDYDVIAIGPVVRVLSRSFDEYWNSPISIPARALADDADAMSLPRFERALAAHRDEMRSGTLSKRTATGQPLSGILGANGVVWAKSEVVYDSPRKAEVENGNAPGVLLRERLIEASKAVERELVIVSPYFVPGLPGTDMLKSLRERGVRVRVLTNSLSSTDVPLVHAAYQHYRVPLLSEGVELFEVKPLPGKPNPRDGDLRAPSAGQFALHAKVFVFDRRRIYVGSANFDQRSFHLNTEVGLLIESPELARQVLERFDAIVQPANSYVVTLADGTNPLALLNWRYEEDGKMVVSSIEPGRDRVRDFTIDVLSLLPLDPLL